MELFSKTIPLTCVPLSFIDNNGVFFLNYFLLFQIII